MIARNISRSRNSDGDETLTYYLTHSFRPEGYSDSVTHAAIGRARAIYGHGGREFFLPVTYNLEPAGAKHARPETRHVRGGVFFRALQALWRCWWRLVARHGAGGAWPLPGAALLHGDVREARVTDIRKLPLRVNGRARYRVTWQRRCRNHGQITDCAARSGAGAERRRCDRDLCGPPHRARLVAKANLSPAPQPFQKRARGAGP